MAKKRKRKMRPTAQRLKRPDWMSKPVPPSLLDAYRQVSATQWEDDELYQRYKEQMEEYLGTSTREALNEGRLIVCLNRMQCGTMNLDYSYRD